ncbi:MAG: glycosyl hydrolase family 18 protein [Clostridiales bacterium]
MKRVYRKKAVICLLVIIAVFATMISMQFGISAGSNKRVIAYFPNWGTYNSAHNNFTVGMFPWDKVSVINHAFFEVDSSFKLKTTDEFADFQKTFEHSGGWDSDSVRGHFGEYKHYKGKYPNVKVLISVGGWTKSQNFSAMATSKSTRKVFIDSVVTFLKKYPFVDGIDLDWEYPGSDRKSDPNDEFDKGCPGKPEDSKNFTLLLKEIREAYNGNNLKNKMLTIAAPAGADKIEKQEPNKYHQYLDFINVMTYDIHGAFENTTNHHSAIYKNPNDPSPTKPNDIKNLYNTEAAMKIFSDKYNVPKSKLNAGSPFYSRGWKGVDDSTGENGLFATANGGAPGTWDNPQSPGGQNPFFKMKELEKQAGYVKYRDKYAKVPYLYNKEKGIMYTYEDEESLAERCNFVNANNYGGIVVWEITGDDTNGFPLMTILHNKLLQGNKPIPVGEDKVTPAPVEKDTTNRDSKDVDEINDQNKEKNNSNSKIPANPGDSGNTVVSKKPENPKETATPGEKDNNKEPIKSDTSNVEEWNNFLKKYEIGDVVKYKNNNYKCIQGHRSLFIWPPDKIPALWIKVSSSDEKDSTPKPTPKNEKSKTDKPSPKETNKPEASEKPKDNDNSNNTKPIKKESRMYLGYAGTWNTSIKDLKTSNIPDYFTHINLSFVKPNTTYKKGSNNFDQKVTGFEFVEGASTNSGQKTFSANDIKELKNNIKQLTSRGTQVWLSVGGWSYSQGAQWNGFNAKNIVDLATDLGASGVDIDWESSGSQCNKKSENEFSCSKDSEIINIITSLDKQIKSSNSKLGISIAGWSTGAYYVKGTKFEEGKVQWGSPYGGTMYRVVKDHGDKIDHINLMSYDGGNYYDPREGYESYRAIYNGPINMGMEVAPEGAGGAVLKLNAESGIKYDAEMLTGKNNIVTKYYNVEIMVNYIKNKGEPNDGFMIWQIWKERVHEKAPSGAASVNSIGKYLCENILENGDSGQTIPDLPKR